MIPKLTFVFDRKGQGSKTKEAVVELRIAADGKRKYISTGISVLPKEWSDGSVVGRKDWKELNDQLQMMKKKCAEVITQLMDDGGFDLNAVPGKLKESMRQQMTFIEYAKELAKGRYNKVSAGTREHYELLFRFLEEWKGMVNFSDLTERNVMRMDDELSGRGLKVQTRWNYHKMVKLFVRQAFEDGLIRRNPYSRVDIKRGNESGLTRYLEPKEFHRFEKCKIPLKKLERVRDLFVFQTYTMMGYSDLVAFDYKACREMKGQTIYKAKRVKTGQEFTVVLLPQALRILECRQRPRPDLPSITISS